MERIKPHIIKAKLYADGRVEWVSVEDGTRPQLNVHQKARQFLQVELADFVLDRESGESLSVAFEQGENKVNRSAMEKQENGIYQIAIPSLVSNTPGVWVTQFFIEQYDIIIPSHVTEFTEYASIVDDGNTMVDEALLQSMFTDILIIKNSAERNIEEAVKSAIFIALLSWFSLLRSHSFAKCSSKFCAIPDGTK